METEKLLSQQRNNGTAEDWFKIDIRRPKRLRGKIVRKIRMRNEVITEDGEIWRYYFLSGGIHWKYKATVFAQPGDTAIK